ncbi:unnamed protein product, partial [Symbiodinium necroappetens]
ASGDFRCSAYVWPLDVRFRVKTPLGPRPEVSSGDFRQDRYLHPTTPGRWTCSCGSQNRDEVDYCRNCGGPSPAQRSRDAEARRRQEEAVEKAQQKREDGERADAGQLTFEDVLHAHSTGFKDGHFPNGLEECPMHARRVDVEACKAMLRQAALTAGHLCYTRINCYSKDDSAVRLAREAFNQLQDSGDSEGQAAALHVLAKAHLARSSFAEAMQAAEEALQRFEALGHAAGHAATLNVLAQSLLREDPEAALKHATAGRDAFRRLGDSRRASMLECTAVGASLACGDTARALKDAE